MDTQQDFLDVLTKLADFEKYLRYERQLSDSTIKNYIMFTKEFGGFIKKTLTSVIKEDFRIFLMSLEQRNMSKAGMANYITALRAYFKWLAYTTKRKHLFEINFFLTKIIRTKRETAIPIVPTPAEIMRLRSTLEAHKKAISFNPQAVLYKTLLREIAAIELLITTGLRSCELRNLKYVNIDLEKQIIFVRKAKGDSQRISLFNDTATRALKEYFENNNFNPTDLIFPFKQGNILNYIIKRWVKRAGINPNLHAHSFRHYFITEALRQGVPLESIAEQVGHRDLNTTRSYTHFSPGFLKEQFARCEI